MLVALVAVKLDDVFDPKVFREKPGGMRHHVSDFWARRRFVSKLLKMELVRLRQLRVGPVCERLC